jgi:glycosyltransferase involved in cell wall biosynthesis
MSKSFILGIAGGESNSVNTKQLYVDIILPYYQGHRWIQQAIDSVLSQTYPHWHLTIVDDASPNAALDAIKNAYKSHMERISFIHLDQRHRAAGARMEAIRRTRGEAIAFIDQDDRWHPTKLELQVEQLKATPQVHAVHTDVKHIDSDGRHMPGSADRENAYRAKIPYHSLKPYRLAKHLFLLDSIRLVSALILRDAFEEAGGFNDTLFGAEDWEFWVRFTSSGHRIAHIPHPLVERRLHSHNTAKAHFLNRNQNMLNIVDQVVLAYPGLAELTSRRKSLLLRQYITKGLTLGQGREVRPQIKQLIQQGGGKSKIVGYTLWLISLLGPLQRPVSQVGLRLIRIITQQGWAIITPRHNGFEQFPSRD